MPPHNDPVLDLLKDLIAIDSVNPTLVPGARGEAEIAAMIADTMRAAGLDVELQDAAPNRPNVIGILEGRRPGPALMLCGHTDTVGIAGMTAPFTPAHRDGRIYGRGAQDMKAGVAAMIDAARVVARSGLDAGRLVVAAVVDEEHSSIGADALVTKYAATAAVVTEPTNLAIAIGHKGFAWVEIETYGKAAHGSRPAEGQDAIFRMGRVLARLEALDAEVQRRPPHPLVGCGSLHASIIEGGQELSSYPDRTVLQMERRLTPVEREGDALADVEQILQDLSKDDAAFRASARTVFSRPAYAIDRDHALPLMLSHAAIKAGAPEPPLVGASFWADSGVLGHAGIPAVLFGPGGAGLHSTEEYVNAADVIVCRDALVALAASFCAAGR